MRHTRIYIPLIILSAMLVCASCQKKVTAASVGIQFDTLRTDTSAMLCITTVGPDSLADTTAAVPPSNASCHIHLSLILLRGKDYASVNDSLLRSGLLSPEYLSLSGQRMTPAAAVDSFVTRYITDYRDFYTLVYAEESNDSSATISYSVDTELRDGRSGITNYVAHVRTDQGAGATGYTQVLNIDLTNRRIMRLGDVFLDGYEQPLGQKIAERLAWQMDVKDLAALRDLGYFVQCAPYATPNFELSDRRIRFIYIEGEIADRAKGETVVEIPYTDLKDIMRR